MWQGWNNLSWSGSGWNIVPKRELKIDSAKKINSLQRDVGKWKTPVSFNYQITPLSGTPWMVFTGLVTQECILASLFFTYISA